METPAPTARPTSLALAESQNIQPKDQAGGSGVQPAKSAMNMNANSSSAAGSASAAMAGSRAPATAAARSSCAGTVGSAEGVLPKTARQRVGGGTSGPPPATPAAAPPARATADTVVATAAAQAAAAFATPAAASAFATPAAPARLAGAGAAREGAGGERGAVAGGGGGGEEGGAAQMATDRMILITPTSASVPKSAGPNGASSPPPAAAGTAASAAAAADPADTPCVPPVDGEAESLALARQLMEEEAMASYAAAVDIFRSSAAAAAAGGGGIEGVAAEDLAAMQALMEEDENSPDAFAMAEDESLDYDGMLELGSAIGDVRKDRWRLRCKAVIAALPRFSYAAGGSVKEEDSKCLVCQCDYEEGDELRKLPCSHVFHTACVDGWLEQNEECPTCRQSVSPSAQA